MIKVKIARTKKELTKCFDIKYNVFHKEQKIPNEIIYDRYDDESEHILAKINNIPGGCARLRVIGKKAKLERMAVLKKYRKRGVGRAIVNYVKKYCRKHHIKEIVLHSQYYIRDFYINCNFKEKGKPFKEAGIKHIEMFIDLKGDKNARRTKNK